jgi:REP element-mobilizing transposase RayT
MRGNPIYLTAPQAEVVLADLHSSADYRHWELAAAAIMANHIHVVVGAPDPSKLLQVFKSYGSRRLNQQFGVPASKTWWTASGSKRTCKDERALWARVCYVADQSFKLALWIHESYREIVTASGGRQSAVEDLDDF